MRSGRRWRESGRQPDNLKHAPAIGDMTDLLERLLRGDIRALARVITRVENRSNGSVEMLRDLFPRAGGATIVGVTGSPGSGKSTLVDKLAMSYRTSERPVGVIAVDPSSPYTGGAILGDRIRMHALENDPGVYIRSMATRGYLGGLAGATTDVVTVLDAAGRDPVIVETVGVGQDEIDIVKLADVSVVVLVPGMGDDIQALKAGIMEIGDIFVINKCDQPGVDKIERAIQAMLSLAPGGNGWDPPIVRVVATSGEGIAELQETVEDCHRRFKEQPVQTERRRRASKDRLMKLLEERLVQFALEQFSDEELGTVVDRISRREQDPYSVVEEILERLNLKRSTS